MRGNGLPDHGNLREFVDVRVFGKVTLVRADDSGQGFLHSGDVSCFRPHQHWFRHASGDIVHLQFLIEWIEKGAGNRFNGIYTIQIPDEFLIAVSKQEFREGHRINLHEVNLTHRERRGFRQGDAQQRAGAGNMELRGILAEILHRIDNFGAVLNLVEDNKSLFWFNFLAASHHQILQDTIDILGGFKELFIFFVLIKVKVSGIFIIASAELF